MTGKNLQKYKEFADIFETWLGAELEAESAVSGNLLAAIRYSLLSPGKRFRPVLALAVGEVLGVSQAKLRSLCLSLEYLHTASLVHDDMPCLDNDSLRRGRPTTHVEFGEAVALLAGDAMIGESFSIILRSQEPTQAEKLQLLGLIGGAIQDLCVGQTMDLEAAEQGTVELKSAPELLRKRHLKKTAALISVAACGPTAFLPDAIGQAKADHLRIFAENLGLLFQITDDILDATSSSEKLGKTAHSDRRLGTPTYVSVYGLAESKRLAAQCATCAENELSRLGGKTSFLSGLIEFVLMREK